jgi:hypothetical protein
LVGTLATLIIWASPDAVWLEVGVAVLLAAGTELMLRSKTEFALAAVLCALCLCPYYLAREEFLDDNGSILQPLRFVIENTSPTDTMMDGWTGIGAFRPHAYFYWFLNPEILSMLTAEQMDELLRDLQTGKIAPRYLVMDESLRHVFARIPWFAWRNFEPDPTEPLIWERKPVRQRATPP